MTYRPASADPDGWIWRARRQRRYVAPVRGATDLTLGAYQDCIDLYCAASPSAVAPQ